MTTHPPNRRANPPATPSTPSAVASARVQLLFAYLSITLLFHALLVPLVAALFWQGDRPMVCVAWIGASYLVLLARALLLRSFRQADPESEHPWLTWFRIGAVATGLAWGLALLIFFPLDDRTGQLILALILAAITARATNSLAVDRVSLLGVVLPSSLSLTVLFALAGGHSSIILSSLVILTATYLVSSAAQQKRNFEELERLRADAHCRELRVQAQSALHNVVGTVATELLATRADTIDRVIYQGLCHASEHLHADRAYLFQLTADRLHISNTHEWCARGIKSHKQQMQSQPLSSMGWWWQQIAANQPIIISSVSALPPEAAAVRVSLEEQHVQSLCAFPIHRHGKVLGFLGFDRVNNSQDWAKETLGLLRLMVDLVESALLRTESERAFIEREQQLLQVQRLTSIGHWRADLVTGELHWSEQVFRIFGRDAIAFRPTLELLYSTAHPEDRATLEMSMQLSRKSGHLDVVHRIIRPDGCVRHVHQLGEVRFDESCQAQWLVGTTQDISDRIQREDRILHTSKRLEFATRSAGLGIWDYDLIKDRMHWNEEMHVITGLSSDRFEGRYSDWEMLIHDDDREQIALSIALLRKLALSSQAFPPVDRHLKQQIRLDGLFRIRHHETCETRWVRSTASVHYAADRIPKRVTGAILDVSELICSRQQTEQANAQIKLNEHRLRGLFELSPIGIALNDYATGQFLQVNEALIRPSGYSRDQFIQLSYWELTPTEYHQAERELLDAMERTGRFGPYEKEYIRKDGSRYPVLLNGMVFVEPSGRKLIWSMIEDISERKRVARLKDEFVSMVSHELRTPLTAISGSLGLLAGGALGQLSPQAGMVVGIAHENSTRLNSLINDLLDIEKLEAGKMRFSVRAHSLLPLLERGLKNCQPYADKYGVRITLSAPRTNAHIAVDQARFEQVLSNLLSNAIKFSPKGADVLVSATTQARRVRVEIKDQGPGVPESFRAQIFEKFLQADSSDRREKGGTGLGLAISRELMERMDGLIGFESIEGKGATFWLELPMIQRTADEPPDDAKPNRPNAS